MKTKAKVAIVTKRIDFADEHTRLYIKELHADAQKKLSDFVSKHVDGPRIPEMCKLINSWGALHGAMQIITGKQYG